MNVSISSMLKELEKKDEIFEKLNINEDQFNEIVTTTLRRTFINVNNSLYQHMHQNFHSQLKYYVDYYTKTMITNNKIYIDYEFIQLLQMFCDEKGITNLNEIINKIVELGCFNSFVENWIMRIEK